MRSSVPLRQYPMLRVAAPANASGVDSGGSCNQSVLPVDGSNASTRPIPFDAYSTPLIISGVDRKLLGTRRPGLRCRNSSAAAGRRHATFKFRTLFLLI